MFLIFIFGTMIELISNFFGICGSIAFAVCLLPQVIACYRTKDASQLSWGFIFLSYLGNLATAEYVAYGDIVNGTLHLPLYFNYGIATTLLSILLYYKLNSR